MSSTTGQQQDLAIRLTIAGQAHEFRVGEYTAVEARLFRREMGVSLQKVFRDGDVDLDIIAALWWLQRRRDNPKLTFEDVAERFTYDDLVAPADDGGEEGSPEA